MDKAPLIDPDDELDFESFVRRKLSRMERQLARLQQKVEFHNKVIWVALVAVVGGAVTGWTSPVKMLLSSSPPPMSSSR
jgi:hypothetical protein